ncbi:MAG: IclR family transcriptional regulator [Pseudoruegeria sp.]
MKTDESENGRSGIQVIARAASILRTLKDNPSGMSLGQIATAVSLPRSTVQRIVNALQTERFIIANSNGSGLRLGPELGALAEATRYNIVEQCRILLTELTQTTGETSDLSVLRDGTMIFLDQVPGTQRLRTVSSVGEVFPVTSTANGRSSLSRLPREEAMKIAKREWERQNLPPQDAQFNQILDDAAQTGLAYDNHEHNDGICAIGFAFTDWSGEIHSVSVPVPSTRFDAKKDSIEAAILTTKHNIEKMMQRGQNGK